MAEELVFKIEAQDVPPDFNPGDWRYNQTLAYIRHQYANFEQLRCNQGTLSLSTQVVATNGYRDDGRRTHLAAAAVPHVDTELTPRRHWKRARLVAAAQQ